MYKIELFKKSEEVLKKEEEIKISKYDAKLLNTFGISQEAILNLCQNDSDFFDSFYRKIGPSKAHRIIHSLEKVDTHQFLQMCSQGESVDSSSHLR